jgi:hypothetical protein
MIEPGKHKIEPFNERFISCQETDLPSYRIRWAKARVPGAHLHCSNPAQWIIDGEKLCGVHAQRRALQILIKEN